MASTFLLEIGTEELPADFARLALPQLKATVAGDLKEWRLNHGAIQVTSTPRRLAVIVENLVERQEDLREDRKGPPVAQAFVDGQPGPAALGFARRCGVDASALEVRATPKGDCVFATVLVEGQSTLSLLQERIPGWIDALQGRRFMRWGSGDQRFSRPVRWLVARLWWRKASTRSRQRQQTPGGRSGTDYFGGTSAGGTRHHRVDHDATG